MNIIIILLLILLIITGFTFICVVIIYRGKNKHSITFHHTKLKGVLQKQIKTNNVF